MSKLSCDHHCTGSIHLSNVTEGNSSIESEIKAATEDGPIAEGKLPCDAREVAGYVKVHDYTHDPTNETLSKEGDTPLSY